MRKTVLIFPFALLSFFSLGWGQDVIFGHQLAVAGYDIRNDSTKAIDDGMSHQIFVESFDFNQTYQRPNDSQVFLVPDQFNAYWLNIIQSESATQIKHRIEEFESQAVQNFQISFNFRLDKLGINATYNRSQGYVRNQLKNSSNYLAYSKVSREVMKFALAPYILFDYDPGLATILKMIPSCPQSANDLFYAKILFQYYGESFPTQLLLGGKYEIITTINDEIVKKKDYRWVTEQIRLTFHFDAFDLDPGEFKNKSDIHIDQEFLNASSTKTFFIGGANTDNLTEWLGSLDDMPMIIGGNFIPISDLVTSDENKRKALEWMATQHANTGDISAPSCAISHKINGKTLPEVQGYIHLGGFDSLSQSTKASLFKFPFGDQVWVNPNYPDYQFAVPNLVKVFNNPESVDMNLTYVAKAKEDYLLELRSRVVYLHNNFLVYSAKDSAEFHIFNHYYDSRSEVMIETMRFITWYDVELVPDAIFNFYENLNPYAKKMIDLLGHDISDPRVKRIYMDFLSIYGDQVATRVSMGLRVHQKAFIQKNVLDVIALNEFVETSKSSFLGIFGSESDFQHMVRSVSKVTVANMRFEVKIEGGGGFRLPNLKRLSSGFYSFKLEELETNIVDWRQLVLSAKDNLQPVRYEVKPIYELFKDEVVINNFKQIIPEFIKERLNLKSVDSHDLEEI